ncbi:Golgi apparatus membrane protein TVP15 [Protomyces lactucae-debilis]|uniref:Golgi apparatus membrane protein TVP15 n=1 Tax=Protomyces lactucae-debilis TaxID=2754530 RepID=A0A1Y2FLH0_PROLT|nr:Golgi apparatus membrane protein TVP15 [Protomyces lactucae-debilis]ORY84427.1 Golgi apparatus membrane protein TVP15 [Protomyces lactucae-debilis]
MDLELVFKGANLGASMIMLLGGLSQFFTGGFKLFIISGYIMAFAVITAALEFTTHPIVVKYCSFLFSFLGRGLFYIFVGGLTLNQSALSIIAASLLILLGIVYIGMEFSPQIERPLNMRDPDEALDDEIEGIV